MRNIRITDCRFRHATESFWHGEVVVHSHSGLHATEKLLIEQLKALKNPPARLLVAGNRTGVTAMVAAHLFPDCEIVCHAFDLHHARAIERNLLSNALQARLGCDPEVTLFSMTDPPIPDRPVHRKVRVACTAQIPEGPYDAAFLMFTHGVMTTELVLDQLEDIHRQLREGGVCVVAAECDPEPMYRQYRQIFGTFSTLYSRRNTHCATMRKTGELAKPRDFSATFEASLPGYPPITLCSLPGVFCHRRPDMGGLALAEIARTETRKNFKVLDMGCGCGMVGCLLAASEPTLRVTFVDSHARALAATARNIRALGLQNTALVLADEGYVEHGFDLFVGNPPYYSDYKIADVFLETAFATLHRGAVCLMVAKTANALTEHQTECFGSVTPIARRGYQVLKSVRAARPDA
ncbi:MAG: methyltransferase [Kiritimatiellae bacterium]|nr:methyltransferase [Kiritimatiellia bacterium]